MFGSGPSIPSLVGRGISMNRLPLAIWAMVLGAFATGARISSWPAWSERSPAGAKCPYSAVGLRERLRARGSSRRAGPSPRSAPDSAADRCCCSPPSVPCWQHRVRSRTQPYETIMAGRIISATAHGAFLGIAAVFAAELVDPARKGGPWHWFSPA